jgi:tRNA G46 methylase TrmB
VGIRTDLNEAMRDWDSLAERDALWAILTDSSKANGQWDIGEFMTTGDSEIQTVMDHLASIDRLPMTAGVALDFGCGVGRLTQSMACQFSSCVGVDISQQMIRRAACSINTQTAGTSRIRIRNCLSLMAVLGSFTATLFSSMCRDALLGSICANL